MSPPHTMLRRQPLHTTTICCYQIRRRACCKSRQVTCLGKVTIIGQLSHQVQVRITCSEVLAAATLCSRAVQLAEVVACASDRLLQWLMSARQTMSWAFLQLLTTHACCCASRSAWRRGVKPNTPPATVLLLPNMNSANPRNRSQPLDNFADTEYFSLCAAVSCTARLMCLGTVMRALTNCPRTTN